MIYGLTTGLEKHPQPLASWSAYFSRIGVGFDDSPTIASRLPLKVNYVNSNIDKFPKLDLLRPPNETIKYFEFALCSEVLEHVTGDPVKAIEGLFSILRAGGFAVVTVPLAEVHEEWYPNLLEVVDQNPSSVTWKDTSGTIRKTENPEYHGGTGDVLSFRVFSKSSIYGMLILGGFKSVRELSLIENHGSSEVVSDGIFLARA